MTKQAGFPFWVLLWAALVAAAVLFAAVVPFELINPDTAQHVSVARNILSGNGLSTGILYYEEQYAAGGLPAPQTLWPPGNPILIAVLGLLGVPELAGAFFLSFLSHLSIAVVLASVALRTGLGRRISISLGIIWLLLAAPGMLPLTAFTEPLFTLCTLFALHALVRAFGPEQASTIRLLVLAGAFSAAAFSLRYIGVTFIAALGIYLGVRFLMKPSKQRFLEAAAYAALPAIVCGLIFGRNILVTGDVTGGPSVDQSASLLETLISLYWSSLAALGVFGSGMFRKLTEALLLLAGVVVGLATLVVVIGKSRDNDVRAQRVVLVSALYCGITALLLVVLAQGRSADLIQWRYVVPLLPFLLLVAAVGGKEMWARLRTRSLKLVVGAAGTTLAACLMISQWQAVRSWDSYFVNARNARGLEAALATPVAGSGTLQDLFERASADDVILTQDGQSLGALVHQSVLGLASPYYTSRVWSREAVGNLIATYQVDWVLFFPGLFFPDGSNDSNKVFFQELARGDVPSWLIPVHRSAAVELYSVDWALFNRTPGAAR